MAKVAIVGAGAMGLAAAYHALKDGHAVTVYEGDKVAGGMAAHFDFDGLSIERFYHFVCKADRPLMALLEELGIADRLVWRETSMGYFIDGKHYDWGDPVALLKFPLLSLREKVGYGLQAFLQTRRKTWDSLENVNAKEWFIKWIGPRGYDVLWRRLMELKFFEYADNISAAWIATRIKRVGTSRKSLLQEELGVIDGGSQVLVDALVSAIATLGGTILLGTPAREIVAEDGRVKGVRTDAGTTEYDAVISTAPTPFVSAMVPALPEAWKAAYDAIRNIGVVCVVLKLKRPVTRHFWLNVNDPAIDDSRHRRILQPQAAAGHRDLRALLHAADPPEIRQAGRLLRRRGDGCHPPAQSGDRRARPDRLAGGAPALCPAGVRARLRGKDPAGADADRGPADCRHLLLLPGRPGYLGKRAVCQDDGRKPQTGWLSGEI